MHCVLTTLMLNMRYTDPLCTVVAQLLVTLSIVLQELRQVASFNLHPRPVGWQHYNPSLQTSARNNWALRTRTSSSKDLRAFYAEAHMGSQVAHLGPCRGRCNPTVMVPLARVCCRSGQVQLVLRAAKCIDNPISPRRPTDQSSISMLCGLCARLLQI